MAKRDRRDFDEHDERRGEWARFEENAPRGPETTFRALALIDRILQITAASEDPKVRHHLLLLRHQLEVDEQQFAEAQKLLSEYEEAYAKLTSPANRIATYLGCPDEGIASVAMGDTEFFCNVDPKLEDPEFKVGTRVRLNEAYAVIGDMGYPTTGPIVKVTEVLEDQRLRVSLDAQGMSGRVVIRCSDLENAPLKVGDEVRMEPNGRVALEQFAQRQVRDYYLEEVPQIPWEKIGGQEEAIRLIRDTIEMPLLYPELYARFEKKALKGILLFGPPGCGKTLIGKATAYNLTQEYRRRTNRDVKEYFMYINGPKILNMWLGESERIVREIFAQARERASEGHLVFIFIDEAESILRTRSSGRYLNIANTVVPQFAAEMDGLVSLENVVVMLTSNRPDYIDPAILRPERIDRKVKVGRPDRRASRDILSIYLHPGIPLDPSAVEAHGGDAGVAREALLDQATAYLFRRNEDTEFLEVHLRNGSVETLYWKDLLSGALLMSVVERAKDFAIKRAIETGSAAAAEPSGRPPGPLPGVSGEDLSRAIRLEYKENEIFPKTDTQEDWLKLLDYEQESVVSLRPIRPGKGDTPGRRNII